MKGLFWATTSFSVLALATPVAAQQATGAEATARTDAAADASGTDPGDTFGDIVVTARRREESLQEVPIAVTAFTPATIVQKAITDRTSLADNTPSLFTINGGYPREFAFFALRGQGPAFGSTPGVINYFAEVPNINSIDGRVGTYYDLANVQVVSGPQGTLFGKNATGGNILFEPAKPRDAYEGYVRAEYGNYDNRRIEGALNLPVVADAVLLRIAGEVGRRDGYTRDVGPNFTGKRYDDLAYQSFRLGLTLRPFDGVENYTMARYYNSDNNGGGTVLGAVNPAAAGLIATIYPAIASQLADQQARGPRRVSYDLNQRSLTDYWQVINQTAIDVTDTMKLRNIASYSEFRSKYTYDYDATPLPLAGQASRSIPVLAPNTFTEELQLQGTAAGKAINYSIGGYLDRQTWSGPAGIEGFTLFPVGTLIPPVPFLQVLRNNSEAVFGQATVDLGVLAPALRGLSVTGGLRYTWEHSFTSTTLIAPPAVEGSFKDDYLSYTATIDYDLTDGVHVYVTSRDAYKSGGVNGPVPEGSTFRTFPAERLSDIEAGLKAQFDLGTMKGRLNVAAYRGDYDNIQRTTAEVVNGVLLNVTRSAAKGRVQGVEVNAALIPVAGLTLNGSYSYIDARYTRVTDASADAILDGAPFPYTPKHKFSVGGTYEASIGGAGDLVASINYVRQTKVSTAQTNQAFYRELPGYGLLNASVGLNDIGGRPLSLTVFGSNLTDVARPVGVIDLYASGAGVVGLTYTEPRMYGIRLGYRFGQ